MAKHRLKTPSRTVSVAKGAVVAGTLSLGAVGATAGTAVADPVTVPGLGSFDIPGVTQAQVNDIFKPGSPLANLPKINLPQVNVPAPSAPPAPAPAPAPAPVVKPLGDRVVDAAETRIGSPYEYGAAGPSAFDCSGLVYWAFKQVGLTVPRDSYGQLGGGTPVSESDLKPGDVLIFYGGSHAGLYVGNGKYIQASTYGVPVGIATLASADLTGARRY